MEPDTNEQEKAIEAASINASLTKILVTNNNNRPLNDIIYLDYKVCSYILYVKSNFAKFDEIVTSARKKRFDGKPILKRNHISIDYLNLNRA